MPQNGRPSFSVLTPDSEGAPAAGSNGAGQFLDYNRRRTRVRQAAAQRGYLDATREARGYGKKDAETAADEMCTLLKQGRLTRAQVEAENRADIDRLIGWSAVGTDPGTEGEQRREAIEYRMRVRELALAKFSAYELVDKTSYARPGQTTPNQPNWARRPGLPGDAGRGGPITR